MRSVPNFRQPEFRERVTKAIFGMLTQMPEPEQNIFVWTHYRGYSPKQIAELAKCSVSEVEAALHKINSTLYRRTRSLIDQDPEGKPMDDTHGLCRSGWQLSSDCVRLDVSAAPLSHGVTRLDSGL